MARRLLRLLRAGRTFARYDGLMLPEQVAALPLPARIALKLGKFGARAPRADAQLQLTQALAELGPSYIKLGQFLATRPDLVGLPRAVQLRQLQDRLPPFSMEDAKLAVRVNLGADVETLFAEFGPPVAAASIAQVHKATTPDGRVVAVKILRPGIATRFAADLDSFLFAARLAERASAEMRRLRPVQAVEVLAHSVTLEMDLRMEASAIAEMAKNTAKDPGFRVPTVDWARTGRQVMTIEWIDGTPLSQIDALRARAVDLKALAATVMQSFLRHAIRDGFFHADMHQGNLFLDMNGELVAVDFGIMGRLTAQEQRFLAEILFGFITRDYMRVAQVHFDAGYVPSTEDPPTFAQALRAIGEPIMDRPAAEISMARLLTQLFEVTGQFNMTTQPQLLLLQKTMVVVEGVSRYLDPDFNMWTASEPVVREWLERKLGASGQLENAAESVLALGRIAVSLPQILGEAQKAAHLLAEMSKSGGLKLDSETTEALAVAQAHHTRFGRYALLIAALSLIVIAVSLI